MRVTLVKSFDEQPTLFSKCIVFIREKWINLDFQVINCFFPDSTEFTDALGKKWYLNIRNKQFSDRREVYAIPNTLQFRGFFDNYLCPFKYDQL